MRMLFGEGNKAIRDPDFLNKTSSAHIKNHLGYPQSTTLINSAINPADPFTGLDYGCGRGFDADWYGLDKYDPHYFPERPYDKYNLITCNYVLNVMDVEEEAEVINHIVYLLKSGGIALFSVRDDLPTGADTVPLPRKGYIQRKSYPHLNPLISTFVRGNIHQVNLLPGFSGFKCFSLLKTSIFPRGLHLSGESDIDPLDSTI